MMGWIIAVGLVLLVAAGCVTLGRLPRSTWELVASALILGLAGYAWQGQPGVAGAPRSATGKAVMFDEELAEKRRNLGEHFGKSPQWLTLSDGLARQGKTQDAANVLVRALEQHPDNADLWVGLGNALVSHGDGILSPSADFSYRRAMGIDPKSISAPYFYGMALARSGQWEAARGQWSTLAGRLPKDSKLKVELDRYIALVDANMTSGKP